MNEGGSEGGDYVYLDVYRYCGRVGERKRKRERNGRKGRGLTVHGVRKTQTKLGMEHEDLSARCIDR